MTTQHIRHDQISVLRSLVLGHPFKPYRNYKSFSRSAQSGVILAEIETALAQPESFVFIDGGEQPASAAVGRKLAWDSAFFGISMARIDCVFGADPESRRASLTACLGSLRAAGVQHVAARVDVADSASAALFQDLGFRLVGGLSTYVARPNKEPPSATRTIGRIRRLSEDDGPELIALAQEAFLGFRSRFHADPRLPRDRVEAFYGEWARRCVSGEMADAVFVSEGRHESILGFLAFRQVEPVSTTSGVQVFGGGLGACRQDTPGAYPGLIRHGIAWAHERNAIAEVQTPSDNWAAIAVFEAAGLRLRRFEYFFHLWIG